MKLSSNAVRDGKLDLEYGKHATGHYLVDGLPKVSFDVEWKLESPESKYVHLLFIDYDSIPVVAMPFIHWSVANIEVEKYPEGIKENASLLLEKSLIQGISSLALEDPGNQQVVENSRGYIGPMPPNNDHQYTLFAWTTKEPLDLKNGYWVNEMIRQLNKVPVYEADKLLAWYPSKI